MYIISVDTQKQEKKLLFITATSTLMQVIKADYTTFYMKIEF